MADNVAVKDFSNASATIATDEVGGAQYQRVKIAVGADGAATDLAPGQVTMAASVPVVIASDQTAVPVSVATVPSHAVTNAGTFAVQVSSITAGDANIGNVDVATVPAPLSTTGGGTEATALRVTLASDSTGVVSIDDNSTTISVDDGAGSLTVDGPLTDTQLRATAVPVSWTAYTVIVTGTVTRVNGAHAAYTIGDVISPSLTEHDPITFTNCARANGGSGFIVDAVLIDGAAEGTKADLALYLFDTTLAPAHDAEPFAPTASEALTCIGVIDFGGTPLAGTTCSVYHAANLEIGFVCGWASRNLFGVLVALNAYDPVDDEVFTIRLKIMQD